MNELVKSQRRSYLPHFLLVGGRAQRHGKVWLRQFLEIGCALRQIEDANEPEPGPAPDLVLFDLAHPSDAIEALRARWPKAAFVVLGTAEERAEAERALAGGARMWLRPDESAARAADALERLLLLGHAAALPKREVRSSRSVGPGELLARPAASPPDLVQAQEPVSEPEPAPPREPSAAIVVVHEVAADGGPLARPALGVDGEAPWEDGRELVLVGVGDTLAETLVLGAEGARGRLWGLFSVAASEHLADGRVRVRCRPVRGARDWLTHEALRPTFDARSMRYRELAGGARARAWAALGVLREVELDRVLVCPRCQALPTFRRGCRRCGSACLEDQRLIHHFPCAHVAPVEDFRLGERLVCPKCAARPLIVNADFEYLEGPSTCGACGAREGRTELVGHCFGCEQRFLARVAASVVLRGFDVDRLVPLDRCTAAG